MDALLKLAQPSPQALATPALPRLGVDAVSDKEAALMFEGLVMTQMFQSMRKTIEPSGLFGDESERRTTYEYLLDQALVEQAMASGKGWGLAERMEKSWAVTRS